jgi:cobyrinic acid a,c-diamide synthase
MKRLVIAGTGSGVGKTSLTLGIIRHLRNQGLKVISFKCGPDYLDPSWHRLASGTECYNLDGWMTDKNYVIDLFNRQSAGYDIAIIEGVMGMFDGASPTSLEGSTAQIANWLDAPVALVCNSHGCARSLAATVKGFDTLEENSSVDTVIANFCGSVGHAHILEDALAAEKLAPLAGWLSRGQLPELPSRHLGLHSAEQFGNAEQIINDIAAALITTINFDLLLKAADRPWSIPSLKPKVVSDKKLTLGLARDAVFQFYYPDNLEMMQDAGFEIIEFSPLIDDEVPECDLLYFGGGYPEVYAEELSNNSSMMTSIQKHAETKYIYAECGGLMYLSQTVHNLEDTKYAMAGLLPFETEMLPKRKILGYMTTTCTDESLLGNSDIQLRGHEFHYSQIINEQQHDWQKVYSLKGRRRTSKSRIEGYWNGRVLASYVHQHFGSNKEAIKHLINYVSNS